jgi:single-strand DNA-binding protein
MNKSILMGRLSADPELRKTESGISVCRFTVAVQEDYKNKDGSRDVDFINCKAWRSTAEYVSKYFKKGSRIAVIGKNKCDISEKDGKKQYYNYIKAESVEFAGYNKSTSGTTDDADRDFPAEFDEIICENSPF